MPRSRRRRSHGRKRQTQWVVGPLWNGSQTCSGIGTNVTGTELVGASSLSAGYDPPIIQRFTVERIRGQIRPYSVSVSGAGSGLTTVGMGIILVRFPVGGGGGVQLPDPLSQADAGQDWLWLDQWLLFQQASGAGNLTYADAYTANQSATPASVSWNDRRVIDIKSKRVVKEGYRLMLLCSAALAGTAVQIQFTHYLRTLISRVA